MSEFQDYLDVRMVTADKATICTIVYRDPEGNEARVYGTAYVTPGDRFDVEIGEHLAYGRALARLSKKYLKRGNGAVKCNDDNAAQRAAQAAAGEEFEKSSPKVGFLSKTSPFTRREPVSRSAVG